MKLQAIVALDLGTNVKSGVTQQQIIHEIGISVAYLAPSSSSSSTAQKEDKKESEFLKASSEKSPFTKIYLVRDEFPELGDKEVIYKKQKDPLMPNVPDHDRISFLDAVSLLVDVLQDLDKEEIPWMFVIHNAQAFDIPTFLYNLELNQGKIKCLSKLEKWNYLYQKLISTFLCSSKQGAFVLKKIPTEAQKKRLGTKEQYARVSLQELHNYCFPTYATTHQVYWHSTRFDAESLAEVYCYLHSNGNEHFPSPVSYLSNPKWKECREYIRPDHSILLRRKLFPNILPKFSKQQPQKQKEEETTERLKNFFIQLSHSEFPLLSEQKDQELKKNLEYKDRLKRFLLLESSRNDKIKFLLQQQVILQEEIRKTLQQEVKQTLEGGERLPNLAELQKYSKEQLQEKEKSLIGTTLLQKIQEIQLVQVPVLPPDPYVKWVPAVSLGSEHETKTSSISSSAVPMITTTTDDHDENCLYSDEEFVEDDMVVLPTRKKSSPETSQIILPFPSTKENWQNHIKTKFLEIQSLCYSAQLIVSSLNSFEVGIHPKWRIELQMTNTNTTQIPNTIQVIERLVLNDIDWSKVTPDQKASSSSSLQASQTAPPQISSVERADQNLEKAKLATSFEIPNVQISFVKQSEMIPLNLESKRDSSLPPPPISNRYSYLTQDFLNQKLDAENTIQKLLQQSATSLLKIQLNASFSIITQQKLEKLKEDLSQKWGVGNKYNHCTYAQLLENYQSYLKTYVVKQKSTKNKTIQDMKDFIAATHCL
jgi:hypothetical protein